MKTKQVRSEELKAELSKTDAKIAEFGPVFEKLAEDLAASNAKFLNNEITIEQLLNAKNHHALISESIDSLAQNRERLEGEIEAALAIEEHEDTVNAMLALATLSRKNFDRYAATRQAFNDATDAMLIAKDEFYKTRGDFVTKLQNLVPGIDADRYPIVLKQHKTQFDAVTAGLTRAGMPREDFEFVMTRRPSFPGLEHANLIGTAEQYQTFEQSNAAHRERIERGDKMRAQQAEAQAAEAVRLDLARRELALKQQTQSREAIEKKLKEAA